MRHCEAKLFHPPQPELENEIKQKASTVVRLATLMLVLSWTIINSVPTGAQKGVSAKDLSLLLASTHLHGCDRAGAYQSQRDCSLPAYSEHLHHAVL